VFVSTGQSAQVGPIAGAAAGDEEAQRILRERQLRSQDQD
jgi:hypothetical protein